MIKTIVFDIGNVLAEFCYERYIQSFGYSEKVNDIIKKSTVLHTIWNEFDRSLMSDREIIEVCKSVHPGYEKEIDLFFQHIQNIVVEYEYSKNWILQLKKAGYQVLLLSNYSRTAYQYAKVNFQFIRETDGGIISYKVHKIKPEPEIYQILLETYSLIPQETIFLDDREENIIAARAFGINGIVFQSLEQAKRELEKFGVIYDN